jgi:hypothetical protein
LGKSSAHEGLWKKIIKILCLLCLPSLLLAANKPDLFLLKTYDDKKSVVGWVMVIAKLWLCFIKLSSW